MGLKIHSLGRVPSDIDRSYFIYLLDYGWDEPLSRGLRRNFDRMASLASRNDAVVIAGFDGEEFTNEVFSWHRIKGQPGDEILPAILITLVIRIGSRSRTSFHTGLGTIPRHSSTIGWFSSRSAVSARPRQT